MDADPALNGPCLCCNRLSSRSINEDFNRVLQLTLAALSLSLAGVLAIVFVQRSKTEYLTLAAGAPSGESHILGKGLKTVVERHYPRVRITLLETGGTVENLQMLEDGRAQLATAQADHRTWPEGTSFGGALLRRLPTVGAKGCAGTEPGGLRGKRIALAQSGGQYKSFLRVVGHFGLQAADFQFVGANDEAATEAFLEGKADAIFRVRAIGDPSIEQLVQSGRVRFLPVEHAAAMKIKYPAFEAALIPVGAYLGNPPVPAQDFPTVAVQRTLLARDSASVTAIRAVTEVLMERRQEMMQQIPAGMTEVRLLLVQVRRPQPQAGLAPALHPGALSFYDKDKPSFLLAHADYVGLFLTVGLMAGSWLWKLKRWMQRKRRRIKRRPSTVIA